MFAMTTKKMTTKKMVAVFATKEQAFLVVKKANALGKCLHICGQPPRLGLTLSNQVKPVLNGFMVVCRVPLGRREQAKKLGFK